jgi:hypothetical protein
LIVECRIQDRLSVRVQSFDAAFTDVHILEQSSAAH